jgi:small subunit ribosomal protein S3
MGQKVNPGSFRLQTTSTWDSLWYSKNDYARKLHEDIKIRYIIFNKLKFANINKVYIVRPANNVVINIHSSRPGVIIGKKGVYINKITQDMSFYIPNSKVVINITEIKTPEIESASIAKTIVEQLERRISFRKAIRRSILDAVKMRAKGVKISVSGRLGGAEIARTEWYKEGRIPLHTLRSSINYSTAEAHTAQGLIGVKVWIYKKEQLDNLKNNTVNRNDTTAKKNKI